MNNRNMAKKDMFPDAYSGGFPPNDESEGSGCSGRVDMDVSGYGESSGYKKKWIKLSSALHDGFGVPVHVVPLTKMSNSEKKNWLFRLRGELDQLRTFQKRVDVDKAQSQAHVVAMSSSNDIFSSSTVQTVRQTNVKRSGGPGKRIDQKGQKVNRGVMGRFQSVDEPPTPAGVFSPILKKQCDSLLKKLMTHPHGWVFNKPVDVVALKIPDYFDVIKNPMDFGTIKEKLSSGKYSNPLEFLADVRLTFSNAMTYNPPGNDVHVMADVLRKFFEIRWKPIEKKLPVNSSQQLPLHEEIDLVKPVPPSKKRKITTIQQEPLPEPVKRMSNEEKHALSRELEDHLADLPDKIIDFLREHSSNGNEGGEDEIEIDIDDLNDDTLFKLRKLLDDHVRDQQNLGKAEPCVIELLHESGLSNSTMQLYRGNDPVDEDVDIGGNEPPVSSYTPLGQEKGANKKSDTGMTSRTSSDTNSRNASENVQNDDVKTSSPLKVSQNDLEDKAGTSDVIDNQSGSGLDQVEHMSQQKPSSVESDSQKDDGDSAPNSMPVSPGKLYRAALLKNRFADTIFKAREKTLTQIEKGDPEKLRREKEELENQKRKEKARLQAAAEAAENARRRAEAEAALEVKRKRDLEREAARQALLKVEKTVEIDETSRFIEDLEMLRTVNPEQLATSVDETSPDHGSLDALGSFNFGSSNPLEQLGLYMKRDEHEEDDGELELPSVVPGGTKEEGEID